MIHWMLVRHAKSDWNDATLSDKQRPLNARGRKAAVLLGEKILSDGMIPERILCSTAVRAYQTLQGILQSLSQYSDRPIPEVLYLDELYLANPQGIADAVEKYHGNKSTIMCIGHNPGLEILASELASENLEMKTAHLIHFRRTSDWNNASLKGKDWEKVGNYRGEEE